MRKLLLSVFAGITLITVLPQPTSAQTICNVGNATGNDTAKIQSAINSCTGGGEVMLTSGQTYTTGTIELKSGVNLRLNGATITTSLNPDDFRKLESWSSLRYIGTTVGTQNVGIYGPGTIKLSRGHDFGISKIVFTATQGIVVKDITIDSTEASPQADGFHLLTKGSDSPVMGSSDILFENVVVRGRRGDDQAWGNDGIDIQNSKNVVIRNCDVDTHDDGIAIATPKQAVEENVLVENCRISSDSTAIKFGTGSRADIKDITFNNITIHNSPRGAIQIAIYDGGEVSNITFSNITIESDVHSTFVCGGGAVGLGDMGDCAGPVDRDGDGTKETAGGYIRDVTFQDFELYGGGDYLWFGESSINTMDRVTFKNMHFHSGSGSTHLAWFRDICGLSISGFTSYLTGDPNIDLNIQPSVSNVRFDGGSPVCNGTGPPPPTPISTSPPAPTPGDTDADGDVDIFDYNNLISDFGKSNSPADFNGSGVVDIFDYNTLVSNFGLN